MLCKLCLQDKPLLKKSHIIPNFMYRGLFDLDHSIYKIDIEKFDDSQKLHTGEFEANILCANCDNVIIGRNESYAKKILYGGRLTLGENITLQNRVNQHGVKTTHGKGVDYAKFKLFLLSILWRASISKREFFKNVYLGPYEEEIRQMLLVSNPREQMDFPCIITTYKNLKDLPDKMIGQPKKYKKDGVLGYSFFIGGCLYIFLVSKKAKKPEWVSEVAINKNNELSVVHMDRENAKKMINHFMQIELVK